MLRLEDGGHANRRPQQMRLWRLGKATLFGVLYLAVSILAALILLWPLNVLFNRMRWPVLNTWELVHGAIGVVMLGLTALCFPFVAYAGQRMRKRRRGAKRS